VFCRPSVCQIVAFLAAEDPSWTPAGALTTLFDNAAATDVLSSCSFDLVDAVLGHLRGADDAEGGGAGVHGDAGGGGAPVVARAASLEILQAVVAAGSPSEALLVLNSYTSSGPTLRTWLDLLAISEEQLGACDDLRSAVFSS
jgi:hypothetical protein